jgi:hypothetical protein
MGWIAAFGLVLLGLAITLVLLGARTPRFAVDGQYIHVSNSLFGRDISLANLDRQSARFVNLNNDRELMPVLRTFGFGLGAKRTGWFRLRNGETALLYLTRSEKLIYIQSRQGYSILFSPEDADCVFKSILTATQ